MATKLYFARGSSSFAAMVALEEAHAAYEAIDVALAAGEQRHPRYLAINPRGRVPALDIGGQIVTENIALLSYIAFCFPQAALLPIDDPPALARAYELLSWFTTGLHVEIAKIWRTERFTDDDAAQRAVQGSGRARFREGVTELESMAAASGRWMMGDRFTVVDAFGLVLWRWAMKLEFDPGHFPVWQGQVRRALERPAVQTAMAREGLRTTA